MSENQKSSLDILTDKIDKLFIESGCTLTEEQKTGSFIIFSHKPVKKNETQEKVDNLNEEIENIRKEFVKKYGSSISNWGNKYLEFNKETSKHQ